MDYDSLTDIKKLLIDAPNLLMEGMSDEDINKAKELVSSIDKTNLDDMQKSNERP